MKYILMFFIIVFSTSCRSNNEPKTEVLPKVGTTEITVDNTTYKCNYIKSDDDNLYILCTKNKDQL